MSGAKTFGDPLGLRKPADPPPVDPAKVASDSLAAQLNIAPAVYDANALYAPKYAALDQQITADSLLGTNGAPGMLDLYGKATSAMGGYDAAANTQQRQADIADVARLGPQARQAYLDANPDLARTMEGLSSRISAQGGVTLPGSTPHWAGAGNLAPATQASAGNLATATPYHAATFSATGVQDSALTPSLVDNARNFAQKTPLQQQLEQQATDALANGGALTASELNTAQQDVRGAYAARGLNDSNGAIGAEVLNTDAARQAKLDRARQFASSTDASGNAALNANRNFATGIEDSLLGRSTFNAGAANNAAATNAAATNAARATNAGAANQFALTQYGTNADLAKTNAGAANQFALTQYGTNADLARSNSALDLQSQLANMDFSRAQQNDQFAREFQLAGMQQSQAQDPFQMVLGRSGAVNQAAGAVGQAGATTATAGPKLFDPFNSALTSIYAGNNANAQASATATGNNNAGYAAAGGSVLLALL